MITKKSRLQVLVPLMVASVTAVKAGVVLYLDQNIPIPNDFIGVSLNLETGGFSNDLAGAPGADANFVFGGEGVSNDADQTASSPSWQPVRSGSGNTDPLFALGVGTLVDSNSTFASGFGGSTDTFSGASPFSPGQPGYLGFSLVLEDGNDTVAYGWMEVTLQNDGVTPGIIHRWAYEDSGAPITIGAIPEPGQGLLVALGCAVSVLRRRRAISKEPTQPVVCRRG